MSAVLEILDRYPKDQGAKEERWWREQVERSLTAAPAGWVRAAGPPESEQLATKRAWALLAWVRGTAAEVPERRELVETAAFAMSLLEASPLDRRDVMVVAIDVRRAAEDAGLPFEKLAGQGCARAGALGEACREWLLQIGRAPAPRPAEPGAGDVWPAWVRYPLIAVGAVALIAAIVASYDRGWLPLAGPFVATIAASLIVLAVVSRGNRRVRRLSADAVEQLRDLGTAVAAERDLAADARPTRASDESLAEAAEQVELALQRFAWGQEMRATPFVDSLATTARDAWQPGAPLSESVDRLARTTSRLDEVVRKMAAAAERRRR